MRTTKTVLLAGIFLFAGGLASADPVIDIWTCKLKDGATAEESQAAGTKWVEIVHKLTGNDEITSSWVWAIVGDTGQFMWIDRYPSLEVWAAAQTAMENSEEFEAVGAALDATSTCSGNRLSNSVIVD